MVSRSKLLFSNNPFLSQAASCKIAGCPDSNYFLDADFHVLAALLILHQTQLEHNL
jgi:hypothetical protein